MGHLRSACRFRLLLSRSVLFLALSVGEVRGHDSVLDALHENGLPPEVTARQEDRDMIHGK